MPSPTTNRTTKIPGVAGTRRRELNFCVQRKVWISSAVSKTAGMTVEKGTVEIRLNSSGLNSSRPRYCQFPVRQLISSNNHQTGADKQKSSANLFRERDQRDVPVRVQTSASTIRTYPSQSGKKRYEVRVPGSIQLSGQQTAINTSPSQPRMRHGRFNRSMRCQKLRRQKAEGTMQKVKGRRQSSHESVRATGRSPRQAPLQRRCEQQHGSPSYR